MGWRYNQLSGFPRPADAIRSRRAAGGENPLEGRLHNEINYMSMRMYVQIPATALRWVKSSGTNKRGRSSGYHWRFHVPKPAPCLGRRLSGLRCRRDRLCHRPLCRSVGDVGDCCRRGKRRSTNSSNGVLGRGSAPDRCEPPSVTRCCLTGAGRLTLGYLARHALRSEALCGNRLAGIEVIRGPAFLPNGHRFRFLNFNR